MEIMKYNGTNEYKCKSTIGFIITMSRRRGSAMEMLLMKMTMEIDVDAFNILAPSPLMWW
jgi:hypothetical protein